MTTTARSYFDALFEDPDLSESSQPTLVDLRDPLLLLKTLYLLSPATIDLLWFSSDEAFESTLDHIKQRALIDLKKAFEKFDIKDVNFESFEKSVNGDLDTTVKLIEIVKSSLEEKQKFSTDVLSKSIDFSYEVTDPSFKAHIRWLLRFLKKNIKEKTSLSKIKDLLIDLNKTDRTHIKSKQIINLLCDFSLYQKAVGVIFPNSTNSIDKPKKSKQIKNCLFLDTLVANGLFKVKMNLKDSVKEIIGDSTTFYESIHIGIIEGIMKGNNICFNMDEMISELCNFEGFDKGIVPFDFEDALLIWINLIDRSFDQNKDKKDFEDLVLAIDDGSILIKTLKYYFPNSESIQNIKIHIGKSRQSKIKNIQIFSKYTKVLNLPPLPWLSDEFAEAGGKGKQGFKMIILTYLIDLVLCIRNSNRIPPNEIIEANPSNVPKKLQLVENEVKKQNIVRISKRKLRELDTATIYQSQIALSAEPAELSATKTDFLEIKTKSVDQNESNPSPILEYLICNPIEINSDIFTKNLVEKIEIVAINQNINLEETATNKSISIGESIDIQTSSECQKVDESTANEEANESSSEFNKPDTLVIIKQQILDSSINQPELKTQEEESFSKEIATKETCEVSLIKTQTKLLALQLFSEFETERPLVVETHQPKHQPTEVGHILNDSLHGMDEIHDNVIADDDSDSDDDYDDEEMNNRMEKLLLTVVVSCEEDIIIEKEEENLSKDGLVLGVEIDHEDENFVCENENAVEIIPSEAQFKFKKEHIFICDNEVKVNKDQQIIIENTPELNDEIKVNIDFSPYFDSLEEYIKQTGSQTDIEVNTIQQNSNSTTNKVSDQTIRTDKLRIEPISQNSKIPVQQKWLKISPISNENQQTHLPSKILSPIATINPIKIPGPPCSFLEFDHHQQHQSSKSSIKMPKSFLQKQLNKTTNVKLSPIYHQKIGMVKVTENVKSDGNTMSKVMSRTVENSIDGFREPKHTNTAENEAEEFSDDDYEKLLVFKPVSMMVDSNCENENETFSDDSQKVMNNLIEINHSESIEKNAKDKKIEFQQKLQKVKEEEKRKQLEQRISVDLERNEEKLKKHMEQMVRLENRIKIRSQRKTEKEIQENKVEKNSRIGTPKKRTPSPPQKSKALSNRTLIRNALIHVCLAGKVNEQILADVLEDLDESPYDNFIILFIGLKNHTFRGLYSYDPSLDQVLKTYADSQGPDSLEMEDILEYYKYDSGSRTFKPIPIKSFGMSVHSVAIRRQATSAKNRVKKVK